MDAPIATNALPIGTRLERYVIEEVLGIGGFGVTYLAKHEILKKRFAIKEHFPTQFAIRDTASGRLAPTDVATFQWALDCFLREGRLLARLRHPNIVVVSDVLEANNTGYMVLEYEGGRSLDEWLRSLGRPPTQAELDALLAPLLAALSYIHARGLLHRDIAPDNIILRDGGGSPCLIDFGAAREAVANRSQTMSAVVKPGYSPPEQYARSGKAQGPWSDIYALAATLYSAVTGEPPPEATERQLLDELKPIAEVLEGQHGYRASFLAAIDAGLRLNVDERPHSIEQLWLKLTEQEAQEPSHLLEHFYQRPTPGSRPPELISERLTFGTFVQRLQRFVAPRRPLVNGAVAVQVKPGRAQTRVRSDWVPQLWLFIMGFSWWFMISLMGTIIGWVAGPNLSKARFFEMLLPLLAFWLALPWPVLVWRARNMRFAGLFGGCLVATLHTAFGVLALSFIAAQSELTNAPSLVALCMIATFLTIVGTAVWLPRSRLPLWISTLRTVTPPGARRSPTLWHRAIVDPLVAFTAKLLEHHQAWQTQRRVASVVCVGFAIAAIALNADLGPARHVITPEHNAQSLSLVPNSMRRASILPKLQNIRGQLARLRAEAVALDEQLNNLVRVMSSIRTERERLLTETSRLKDARMRLVGLLQVSKRQALAESQAELERARQAEAGISRNISDLVDHELLDATPRHAKELQADVEKIAAEIERMTARLVETGRLVQQSEGQLNLIDSRMTELQHQEQSLRASLEERRGSISALLAKMQRIRGTAFKGREE